MQLQNSKIMSSELSVYKNNNDNNNNDNNNNDKTNCISGKTLLLLDSLMEYYSNNINILTNIFTQKNTLSLRILDWLVTNYSKKNNIIYTIRDKCGNNINFNIYLEYKNQLKAYSKKYFDPFCRRDRIVINTENLTWSLYDDSKKSYKNEIVTTVGQLNFFKWLIENNVLNYAIENIIAIDKDMGETLKNNKNKEKKRKELSKNASKTICSYNCCVVVNFE